MLIKQKNCLIANLCPILSAHNVSLHDFFWALVDISDINYATHALDWVPCYLTELGIYTDALWSAVQITHFEALQQQIINTPNRLQLIIAPIKNLTYRRDLGNYTHQNERHALLIHKNNQLLLEDLAIGISGEIYSATSLNKSQFIFPFTYWKFDSDIFMQRLFSIDLRKKTRAYAYQLIERYAQIRTLKQHLLLNAIQKNNFSQLVSTNLYEESYYYRSFFISYASTDTQMLAHHDKYKRMLTKFKEIFLRMQYSSSEDALQKLKNKAIDQINCLSDLDQEFYDAFAKHV